MSAPIEEPVLPVWEATKRIEGWNPHEIWTASVGPAPTAEDVQREDENRTHEILLSSSPNVPTAPMPTIIYEGPVIKDEEVDTKVIEGQVIDVIETHDTVVPPNPPMTDEELDQAVIDAVELGSFKSANALHSHLRKSNAISYDRVNKAWKAAHDGSA